MTHDRITNESREAAPRPRHHGDFRTRTHIRASSLPKMSAGITNPCASIKQPARALALGTDRPAHAGQRNNHYGCPTVRKAAQGPSSHSQGVRPEHRRVAAEARRRRWRPKRGAADGKRPPSESREAPPRGNVQFRATCSSSEREMWRVDEI